MRADAILAAFGRDERIFRSGKNLPDGLVQTAAGHKPAGKGALMGTIGTVLAGAFAIYVVCKIAEAVFGVDLSWLTGDDKPNGSSQK